jgi:hypothetical protein
MGNKFSYTDVLSLVSAQLQEVQVQLRVIDKKTDRRLEGIEEKLDSTAQRVTRLESATSSNLRWLGWIGGVVLFGLQVYQILYK